MGWIKANDYFNNITQDWVFQYWTLKEQDPRYREALALSMQLLWPGNDASQCGKSKSRYFLLPSLCSHAFGHSPAAITAVNSSWALLYVASFLLDKVEDRETGHLVFLTFNEGVIANLATGLILHSERILAELESDSFTDTCTIDAIRRKFNQKALEVCAGQHLDLTVEVPSLSQAWEIVGAKSGEFFALGAYLGARLATNEIGKVETFSRIGKLLGILIQIANDISGFGNEDDPANDLASGKCTLPVIYALHVLPEKDRKSLVAQLAAAPKDKSAEKEARRRIISAGAIVYLSLEAEKHRQQAVNALNQMNLNPENTRPLFDLLDCAGHSTKSKYRAS